MRKDSRSEPLQTGFDLTDHVKRPVAEDGAVLSLIRSLLDGPCSFSMEAPPAVEAVEFWQEEQGRAVVTVINLQELTPPVTVHGIRLTVNLKGKALKRACLLPEGTPLATQERDGAVTVELPPLEIERMVSFEF